MPGAALGRRPLPGRLRRQLPQGSGPSPRAGVAGEDELRDRRPPPEVLDSFADEGARPFDFVITVCDRAAGEVCPAWPGQPIGAHWGVDDPAAVAGDERAVAKAFPDAYLLLEARIKLFTALPIASLDRLTLKKRLAEIARAENTAF